jgi:hypothetical protein
MAVSETDALVNAAVAIALSHSNYGREAGNKRAFAIADDLRRKLPLTTPAATRAWVVRSTTTPGAIHFNAVGFEVTDNGVYFELDPASDEPQIFFSHPVSVMPEYLS